MRGVCDREGVVEKVKDGLVDADVGLLEGYPASEPVMTRGERRGRLRAWVASLVFLSESIDRLD